MSCEFRSTSIWPIWAATLKSFSRSSMQLYTTSKSVKVPASDAPVSLPLWTISIKYARKSLLQNCTYSEHPSFLVAAIWSQLVCHPPLASLGQGPLLASSCLLRALIYLVVTLEWKFLVLVRKAWQGEVRVCSSDWSHRCSVDLERQAHP